MNNLKFAICQVADTGPLESLVVMLRSVGIEPVLPNTPLRDELRRLGCDTVLDIPDLVRNMGYEHPMVLGKAGPADMSRSDVLYVDVKGHRNAPRVWKKWSNLKVLWYRINGAQPEHVVKPDGTDHGDEINPPCPVLTPNQWYDMSHVRGKFNGLGHCCCCNDGPFASAREADAHLKTCQQQRHDYYAFWPPFNRFHEYLAPRVHDKANKNRYEAPICLIHNVAGWGYRDLIDQFRSKLGVQIYGQGSPDGLINHREVPVRLSSAVAMVHLKSNDAPGYAIYEALAAACPIICTRRLIWRCRMQELLIPGKTCLVFDRETHEGLTQQDVADCLTEVSGHLAALAHSDYNREIGDAGRIRLQEVMWSADKRDDVASLRAFIERNFGQRN